MINLMILGVIVIVVASSILYIVNQKKKGVKCIGCSVGGTCSQAQKMSVCRCECNGVEVLKGGEENETA